MHAGRTLLIGLMAITPFSIVLHEQGDTLATVTTPEGTQIEIAAGSGEYAFVSRGCEGQVTRRRAAAFRDAAVRVQQPVGGGLAIGVRAGVMHDDIGGGDARVSPLPPLPGETAQPRQVTDNRYLNPYFVYEKSGGSVGLGYVWHEREFPTAGEGAREQVDHPLNDLSGHLRFGSERKHFEVRWMEGMPLAADGGLLSIGVGGRPNGGPTTMFVGLGAGGPYEGAGVALRVGRDIGDFNVGVRSRLGSSGGANASSVGLGIQYSPGAARRP